MTTQSPKRALWLALGYAWQFGYSITVPLVVFALLGRWLDKRLHVAPWFLLAGILLAIAASSFLLVRKTFQITRAFDSENHPNDKTKTRSND